MPILPSTSPHLRAVKAAHDAAERAERATDLDAQLHALIEAVWWISAANDYLRALHGTAYEATRDESNTGRMVSGIWWVRSAAIHDPFGVTSLVERADWPDDAEYPNGVYLWLPLGEIEGLGRRLASTFGREEYGQLLANGPPVIETVRSAVNWLHRLRTEDLPKRS